MAAISSFYGIYIQMFWENSSTPHFHARYRDYNGIININTSQMIEGDLPEGALSLILDWSECYQQELLINWELCLNKKRPNTINPLVEEDIYLPKIHSFYNEILELINEYQDRYFTDVRLIALHHIREVLYHVIKQLKMITKEPHGMIDVHLENISKQKEKFPDINDQTWAAVMSVIADVLNTSYRLLPSMNDNYSYYNETDWLFLKGQISSQLLLQITPAIDNLFSHLTNNKKSSFSEKLIVLKEKFAIPQELIEQLKNWSYYRNAWTHSNSLKQDGTFARLNLSKILRMFEGSIMAVLVIILRHEKIKDIHQIEDEAASKYLEDLAQLKTKSTLRDREVVSVDPVKYLELEVKFLDGLEGLVKIKPSFLTGIFEPLKDQQYFKQVFVEHGVVTWPGEIGLAPDVMYNMIKNNSEWVIY